MGDGANPQNAQSKGMSEFEKLQKETEKQAGRIKNEKVIKGKRDLKGVPYIILSVAAVGGVLFQLWNAGFGLLSAIQLRSFHWAYMAFAAFLIYPAFGRSSKTKVSAADWVLAFAALGTSLYIYFSWQDIAARLGFTVPREVVLGVISIVLVLELVRRVVGIPLLITIAVFIAYAFLGPWMPGALIHRGIPLEGLIRVLYISTDGIFGMPLGISASFVVLFIVFGAFLQESGGGKLFTDLAFAMVGKSTGGPAKASVVSSALMGMISPAAVANVVSTGIFTIPLMKKTGYKAHTAAAIEAITSNGGQIMPPVMGAAAFMMAEMVGVPFRTIAIAALFPALMYFLFLFVCVHLQAKKMGMKGLSAELLPSVKLALKERGHLLIPLIVLIGLLISGRSPGMSVFWAIIFIVAISALRKNTRLGPKQILNALRNGAVSTLPVAVACAGAGIITGVIAVTGVGLRFSSILIYFSGGYLLPMLALSMIAAIVIGMGLPTSAAYAILSVLTAPALINLGVQPLAAHFFIFFFGCLSTVTPPVGLSSFAAAGIAEADPMKTSFESFRFGLIGFIIPFMAVYNPKLLLIGAPRDIVTAMIFSVIAVVFLTFAVQGVVFRDLKLYERAMFLIPALIVFLPTGFFVDLAAVGVGLLALLLSRRGRVVEAAA